MQKSTGQTQLLSALPGKQWDDTMVNFGEMERLALQTVFSSRAETKWESVRLAVGPIKVLFGTIQTNSEAVTHGHAPEVGRQV